MTSLMGTIAEVIQPVGAAERANQESQFNEGRTGAVITRICHHPARPATLLLCSADLGHDHEQVVMRGIVPEMFFGRGALDPRTNRLRQVA